ncbi:hypothetical protein [Streptomyces cucumeris]|uniref:hypothetical protein n=1 Tax=Streptomyces cucumeris TaxID=2962890 RepID=UPI0020C90D9C|nr:hypothetical protein [Streptomyces sp. NEAU-Y11]MCP9209678.1 hypothetical protein [Streptomyces sp. NEAU-Y11]
MATTENEAQPESREAGTAQKFKNDKTQPTEISKDERRFTFLVFLACLLSVGSLAYSTYSFLDLNKIDAMRIEKLGGVSFIGLSAAVTMDIIWSATMVADYRGRKVWYRRKNKDPRNILPAIGWLEVLAIAAMLGYHGQQLGGWTAAFTAVLPIAAKFTWILALDDIRDPYGLTDEQKMEIAKDRRNARLAKAKADATAELHEAQMEQRRRSNEAKLEDQRAAADQQRMQQRLTFDLKQNELVAANDLKMLENQLRARLQISTLDNRAEVETMRAEHEWELSLRRPPRTVIGDVVRPGLPKADLPELPSGEAPDFTDLASFGLTTSQQKRAALARDFYEVDDRQRGGVTKKAFCEANRIAAPRLSEATSDFPLEWFIDRGLATWRADRG